MGSCQSTRALHKLEIGDLGLGGSLEDGACGIWSLGDQKIHGLRALESSILVRDGTSCLGSPGAWESGLRCPGSLGCSLSNRFLPPSPKDLVVGGFLSLGLGS